MRARGSVVAALSIAALVFPLPAQGFGVPATLLRTLRLGALAGTSAVVAAPFPIDFLGVSWRMGTEPAVRFLQPSGWGPWREVEEEEMSTGTRVHARLVGGGDARSFQVRGLNGGLEATILNTTDGPRPRIWGTPAEASHRPQGGVVTRAGWAADESFRFTSGSEEAPQAFFPVQKLVVHHTATEPADADPAATVRAIYGYHAQTLDLGDIAYHFLIDPAGVVYKGRYSGPVGTTVNDTITGEDPGRELVRGAHVELNNSGTMGIALLGDFSTTGPTDAARAALVSLLSWAVERHGLDPEATDTFVNPTSGETRDVAEISGHRAWKPTACPGDVLDADLPVIRHEVALAVGPRIDAGLAATQLARTFTVGWGWGSTAASNYSIQVRTARFNRRLGEATVLLAGTTATSAAFTGAPGRTHCFEAAATDTGGASSAWGEARCAAIPLDDRALSRTGTWRKGRSGASYLKTFLESSERGAALSLRRVVVGAIAIVATRCPGCGTLLVFVGKRRVGRVRLKASSRRPAQVIPVADFEGLRTGRLRLVVASQGRPVRIEGVAILGA